MKLALTNKHIFIHTRKEPWYIEPILRYECKGWTISKQLQKKLEAIKMWFQQRMLLIPCPAKKSNKSAQGEADTIKSLRSSLHKC